MRKMQKVSPVFVRKVLFLVSAVTLALIFRSHIIAIVVHGNSMYPTLVDGRFLLVDRVHTSAEHGDLIVAQTSEENGKILIIKRVIAVGGETVRINYSSNEIYINGELIDEPYINLDDVDPLKQKQCEEIVEYTVPEGSVFVMGDNRNCSQDSRDSRIGYITQERILGIVLLSR